MMWWGQTPALDIGKEVDGSEVNVLLLAQSDCRHVLQTLAKRYCHSKGSVLKLFVYEPHLENVARSLLFLILALDEQLGLGLKTQFFMELYGNTLLRPTAWNYLTTTASRLIKVITNFNYATNILPAVSLDSLKYKERDQLENIFKYWCSEPNVDILSLWDKRLRDLLGTRYDSRVGAFDWDLHMRYRPYGAETVGNTEYKCFRQKGVAFHQIETDPSIPNLTLSSFPSNSSSPAIAYMGDIVTGPYPPFGLNCEDKDLLKKCNGQIRKTATEITEWNVQKMLYEIANNHPFSPTKDIEEHGQMYRQDCSSQLKVQKPLWKRKFEEDVYSSILIQGTEVIFLPTNALKDYPGKPQFQNFFDFVTVPQHYVSQLPFNWSSVCKPNAKVLVESSKYFLHLRKEDLAKAKVDVDNALKNVCCEPFGTFDYKVDDYIRYVFNK